MAGDRIAFAFTALIMIAIFAVIVVAVRDTKKEPSAAERANALRLPTKADDHIAVDLAMNKQPYFVHSTDSIREVAQILATNKTSGVPVVGEQGFRSRSSFNMTIWSGRTMVSYTAESPCG